MKKWKVTFDGVGMCAEHREVFTVEANSERKAIIFAENKLKEIGYKYYDTVFAKEILYN